jgi:hypothetical protein
MKIKLFILSITLSASVFGADVIKLDSAAFNPQDSTSVLQKAFASGVKKVIITRQLSPWLVQKPLRLSGNQEISFEDGAEIKAMPGAFKGVNEALLIASGCENLTLSGHGILTMNKKDYQNPKEYKPAEWRHTLGLFNCKNIKIDGLTMRDSGGDGIYINGVKNILINAVTLKNHHRQGISVISAENLLIKNSLLEDTGGAPPMAGIDFEPNRSNEYLLNCVVEKCRFVNNKGAGVLLALACLDAGTTPISVTVKDCELSGNKMGVSIENMRQAAVRGNINFINCRISASQSFTFRAKAQTVKGYKISLENCILDNRGAASDTAFEITGDRISGPLGNVHFDRVKVIDDRQNPVPFKSSRANSLQKLTGSMTDASGKQVAMADILKKYQSVKAFSNAKLYPEKLSPVRGVVRKTTITPLKMRYIGTFLQYAQKGKKIKVRVHAIRLGRHNSPVDLEIISPSGKLLEKRKVKVDQPPEIISFNAGENGIYRFQYKSINDVIFTSDSPGNGYLVDRPICVNASLGKVYFLAPAGTREVAVRVSGEEKETVTATLFDPAGKAVVRKEKISSPQLLYCVKKNPDKDEVWSIDFSQVVDDFNFAILGEAIPIASDAPDKLLTITK